MWLNLALDFIYPHSLPRMPLPMKLLFPLFLLPLAAQRFPPPPYHSTSHLPSLHSMPGNMYFISLSSKCTISTWILVLTALMTSCFWICAQEWQVEISQDFKLGELHCQFSHGLCRGVFTVQQGG